MFKKLFYLYQKSMWYMGIAATEAHKPLQFLNEAIGILTLLTVRGILIERNEAILAYICIIIIAIIIGKILVRIGVVSYNSRLGNSQNPELLQILEEIKKINKKLDDQTRT